MSRAAQTQLALRKWTLFNGLREYMFDQLRKASDADRKAARQWVAKAMRTGEPPAAADPVPVVRQKSKRRPSQARPRAAPLDAATADPMEC